MKIAIITGGETGERSVSIKSATNIKNLIDFAETKTFIFPEEREDFLSSYKDFDLVIPVIHGLGGEDGQLQMLLNSLNIPFIFSDSDGHAIAIDKKLAKEKVKLIGVNSPEEIENTFPMFVKPQFGGSSIATKLCENNEDLSNLLKENPGINFLKEKPIKGREFTVGVVEYEGKNIALPVIEIVSKNTFFDFESKYDQNKLANEICPAEINSDLENQLKKQTLAIHDYLGIRHISRSDFIVTDDGEIYFLEINTIPGMTDTSLIPKMIKTAGLSLREILKDWCLDK